MDRNELVPSLAQLHEELSRIDPMDPATLEQLRKLTADIGRLLDQKQALAAEDAEGVTSGLRDLVLKFEVEHPQLATTVGKVVDALAAMGI